jgi:hypothetical protein
MLCNTLIQPHFDFACSAWYPNLKKGLKKELQIPQNKCIRFYLFLGNRVSDTSILPKLIGFQWLRGFINLSLPVFISFSTN